MPKQIRVWYRRERKRWYGEYWLNYKRHAKAFKNKADALLWKSYMQHKFNYEDWQGIIGLNWSDLTKLYLNHKDAQDIAPTTRIEIVNSLKQFTQLVGTPMSDTINQGHYRHVLWDFIVESCGRCNCAYDESEMIGHARPKALLCARRKQVRTRCSQNERLIPADAH